MPFSGIVDPHQLTILTTAVGDIAVRLALSQLAQSGMKLRAL